MPKIYCYEFSIIFIIHPKSCLQSNNMIKELFLENYKFQPFLYINFVSKYRLFLYLACSAFNVAPWILFTIFFHGCIIKYKLNTHKIKYSVPKVRMLSMSFPELFHIANLKEMKTECDLKKQWRVWKARHTEKFNAAK